MTSNKKYETYYYATRSAHWLIYLNTITHLKVQIIKCELEISGFVETQTKSLNYNCY